MTRSTKQLGFTLVELMVALTGGLFLSIVVFALARDGQRFYQRESRLADATLAAMAGFDRLRADIARAGFLASPNINLDPRICSRPVAGAWPEQLAKLRSIVIDPDAPVGSTALSANLRQPHRLILAGSYSSTDEFPIRTFAPSIGGAQQIFLQTQSGAMARLGYDGSSSSILATVFGVGRAVRLVDKEGMQHYGVIADVAGGANPSITLESSPPITMRSGATPQCGTKGFETGATLNVVNFIQYDVRSLTADANYAKLFALSAGAPGEALRTELVREELDPAGQPIAGTKELVAEYAVDLAFGLTTANGVTNAAGPTVAAVASADVGDVAGDTSNTTQHIRAVRARLSVRSREGDRLADLPPATAGVNGLFRFTVVPSPGTGKPAQVARVRTFQAEIALHNQERALW